MSAVAPRLPGFLAVALGANVDREGGTWYDFISMSATSHRFCCATSLATLKPDRSIQLWTLCYPLTRQAVNTMHI